MMTYGPPGSCSGSGRTLRPRLCRSRMRSWGGMAGSLGGDRGVAREDGREAHPFVDLDRLVEVLVRNLLVAAQFHDVVRVGVVPRLRQDLADREFLLVGRQGLVVDVERRHVLVGLGFLLGLGGSHVLRSRRTKLYSPVNVFKACPPQGFLADRNTDIHNPSGESCGKGASRRQGAGKGTGGQARPPPRTGWLHRIREPCLGSLGTARRCHALHCSYTCESPQGEGVRCP